MEEIIAVASAAIRRTDPNCVPDVSAGVCAPGLVVITREPELARELNVPTGIRMMVGRIGETFRWKEVVVCLGIKMDCERPLVEVADTVDSSRFIFGLRERRKQQSREDRVDGDHDHQLDKA